MEYKSFAVERLRDILKLGIAMQEEGDYSGVPFDIEKASQSILQMVIKNPNAFGVLAYDGDTPVGMIAGSVTPYFFSRGMMASDYVWYVQPEYRGSRAAIKMLKMFLSWSRDMGAMEAYVGVSTNVSPQRTGKLLERLGFTHIGGNYKVELHG